MMAVALSCLVILQMEGSEHVFVYFEAEQTNFADILVGGRERKRICKDASKFLF